MIRRPEALEPPTYDEVTARATVYREGQPLLACWYPQMGGYGSRCLVQSNDNERDGKPEDACFDVYVWHDGEFPFSAGSPRDPGTGPSVLHHCRAQQFIDFGEQVKAAFARGLGKN